VDTNEQKAEMLCNTFFPKTRGSMGAALTAHKYPTPAFEYQPVTDKKICRAVKKVNPFKSPGKNGIPNIVIKQSIDVLVPHLGPVYHGTSA
jgi:hypothetical protein